MPSNNSAAIFRRPSDSRCLLHAIAVLMLVTIHAEQSTGAENKAVPAQNGKAPNIVFIMADDKCDVPGARAAEEAETTGIRASEPDF